MAVDGFPSRIRRIVPLERMYSAFDGAFSEIRRKKQSASRIQSQVVRRTVRSPCIRPNSPVIRCGSGSRQGLRSRPVYPTAALNNCDVGAWKSLEIDDFSTNDVPLSTLKCDIGGRQSLSLGQCRVGGKSRCRGGRGVRLRSGYALPAANAPAAAKNLLRADARSRWPAHHFPLRSPEQPSHAAGDGPVARRLASLTVQHFRV